MSNTGNIIKYFLNILDTVKLYHWTTTSYARHKASDKLHEKLSVLVDKFVEIYIGKYGRPLTLKNIDIGNYENFELYLKEIGQTLVELSLLLNKDFDQDFINLVAEIQGNINQTLYLFTLN